MNKNINDWGGYEKEDTHRKNIYKSRQPNYAHLYFQVLPKKTFLNLLEINPDHKSEVCLYNIYSAFTMNCSANK